jgi:hypothetical protein
MYIKLVVYIHNVCIIIGYPVIKRGGEGRGGGGIPLKRGEEGRGWYPINQFNPPTCLCLSQSRNWISVIYCGLFFVFSQR